MRKRTELDKHSQIKTAYIVLLVTTILWAAVIVVNSVIWSVVFYWWLFLVIAPFGAITWTLYYTFAMIRLQTCHNQYITRRNSDYMLALQVAKAKNDEEEIRKIIILLENEENNNDDSIE